MVVLALGALAGCGGSESEEGEAKSVPPDPEAANNIVVRVSGTEGTAYSGIYETLVEASPQTVDGTLASEPVDYEVEVQEGVSDGVSAFFQKTQPGGGSLKAEILADDESIVDSTTYAELGVVTVEWLPQAGLPEDALFEEEPLEEPSPEESR